MPVKPVIILSCFLFCVFCAGAQKCTTIGQTPSTAFPVCGTTAFEQSDVPVCSSNSLYVPTCSNTDDALYANKNPFWYKFTCYKSGTLGFLITPNELADDYDWQLYDVTGLAPDEVYTNKNIIVTGNWAGNPGSTGASASGVSYIQCASDYDGNEPRFAKMPNIIKGHEYILLVSHYTDSQSGYSLSFGGGTASITDTTLPGLQAINSSCDATKLYIKLNKSMKCSSLAANGSDFTISSPGINIISAVAICNGFDMDSLLLELSAPLPPGNYTVTVKNGTDGNTLLDNCGTSIPVGNSLPLTIFPLVPTPMDSLSAVQCAPQSLQLVFRKNIRCNSVSPDGSDFMVTGPSPVNVIGAVTDCNNLGSRIITIKLSAPIVNAGVYQVKLKPGNDGNTIIDECGQPTPIGSALNFSLKDTVSADFTYQMAGDCKTHTFHFFHNGRNGVDQWNWQLDSNGQSNLQNPVTVFTGYDDKQITLQVSNGFCSDTVARKIIFANKLKAEFETNNILCPEDSAIFKNESTGNIVSYQWNFKNGFSSMVRDPAAQKFPILLMEKNYPVSLVIQNDKGCYDTAIHNIKVLKSCYIDVPNAFTPNGDGLNDFLYPLNAYKADDLEFKVYNRLGQLVFQSGDRTLKWDGTVKSQPQDAGMYVWTLKYILHDTGKPVFKKGATVLIR